MLSWAMASLPLGSDLSVTYLKTEKSVWVLGLSRGAYHRWLPRASLGPSACFSVVTEEGGVGRPLFFFPGTESLELPWRLGD